MEEEARLLIDMDGTLAKFQPVEKLETLYEKGYFRNLEPLHNVVEAIRKIIQEHPRKQIYIMSAVLSDSKYALQEKNEWLDQYLPEIDLQHRIFPSCGENKLDHVPGGIRSTDHLLDDYTTNLILWEPPAKGIKLLNGINHTKESWKGNMLRFTKRPEVLAQNIVDIMERNILIQDERPVSQSVMFANQNYAKDVKTDYISNAVKDQLEFLTKEQAYRALHEGIHICCVNDYPEYPGIHDDKYLMKEMVGYQNVRDLYDSFGTGIIHKAFISPYYEDAKGLKELLQCEAALDQSRRWKEASKKQLENKSPKL